MNMTNEERKMLIDSKEENKKYMNDFSNMFVHDMKIEYDYFFDDGLREYANSNVDVYSSDLKAFYNNNVELCENSLKEDNPNFIDILSNGGTIGDLIDEAARCGEFRFYYNQLSEDIQEIIINLIIDYLLDNNKYLDYDTIEYIKDQFYFKNNINKTSVLIDLINEELENIEE